VCVDVFVEATKRGRRQAAARTLGGHHGPERITEIGARPRVEDIAAGAHARLLLRRGHECRPGLVTADGDEDGRHVDSLAAPKRRRVTLEDAPQADAGLEHGIIDRQRRARDAIGADDPLVAVDGEQKSARPLFGRSDGNDPCSAEYGAEQAFLDRPRRCHGERAGQRMSPFREGRIDRGHVQHGEQAAVGVENRRT
jgi:hypothetical protein